MQKIIVRVKTKEQLEAVLESQLAEEVIGGAALIPLVQTMEPEQLYIELPDVARENKIENVQEMISKAREKGYGLLVKNLDELAMILETGFSGKVIGDSFLYAYNKEAVDFYREAVPEIQLLAADELSDDELKGLSRESKIPLIVKIYGHQQLMITNQCLKKNYVGCAKAKGDLTPQVIKYADEKGNIFFAVNECSQCCNTIYHGPATSMIDKIGGLAAENVFVDFTVETKKETKDVLIALEKAVQGQPGSLKGKTTRGYHYKGID